jgi:predicted 2-oxoglutarate/Fe(II)-dependent dioxygenase YbiX|tara:strand:+ start:888 stop:1475 length:588 start_codon:yes stop_codon:yes gene_type:complete
MSSKKVYTNNPDIIIYENILTNEDCDKIASFMIDAKKHNPNFGTGMPWEKGNNMFLHDIPDRFQDCILSYRERLTSVVSEEYHKILYPTHSDMVLWNEGDFMIPHVDNGSRGTEQDRINLGFRDYSAVTYLNDDFEGGETFVEDYTNTPKSGSVIVFPSGFEHGVKEVIKGKRVTFAMWFTENASKIEHIQQKNF